MLKPFKILAVHHLYNREAAIHKVEDLFLVAINGGEVIQTQVLLCETTK